MVGKHHKWHTRWQVDLATCTATHDSGLVLRFVQSAPGVWDGEATNAEAWFSSMKDKMPPQDLASHATRLMREAGDAYMWQLQRRH